jgi:AraC-like DNA-binding protein
MREAQDLLPVDLTLEHFRATLGPPLGLRRVRQRGRVIGAIGRWRHEGRRIGLADVKATRLIFGLNGGQALQWRSGRDVASAIARCGSVSVAEHGMDATLEIHGRGDTLQILIDPLWLKRSVSAEREPWTEAEGAQRRLALSAQALVALSVSSDFDIRAIVEAAAPYMSQQRTMPLRHARGGLAPATLRRIRCLVERQLEHEPDRIPSVRALADEAGVSLFHFIRAFKVCEGVTPHGWIVGRRLEKAVALLLGGQSPVTDTAIFAGYSSAAHFIDGFRRTLGVTPGQLRSASLAE